MNHVSFLRSACHAIGQYMVMAMSRLPRLLRHVFGLMLLCACLTRVLKLCCAQTEAVAKLASRG